MTLPESLHKVMLPVGAILLAMTGGLLYFTWYYSDPLPTPTSAPKNTRAPQHWVDAVTQRPVTAKCLSADKDFRMGELNPGTSFQRPSSCLKTPWQLTLTIFRLWFAPGIAACSLATIKRRQKSSRKHSASSLQLKALISILQKFAQQKKPEQAEKYLRAEYSLRSDLTVGMELANFLARQGNQNEAMELISALRKKHPGKMLVLAPETKPGENAAKEGQRQ